MWRAVETMNPQRLSQVAHCAIKIVFEDAHGGPGSQWLSLGRPGGNDVVEIRQICALCKLPTRYLLVKEMHVFGVGILGAAFQHERCHLLERRGALHSGNTAGN